MITPIELSLSQWESLLPRLIADHGASIAISTTMRRKLGFVRRWKQWQKDGCYLDFWEEKYKTLFILRYM
jgi:hypothetical protein